MFQRHGAEEHGDARAGLHPLGPIGLLLLQLARLSGADPVYITDPCEWRLKQAERWGYKGIEFQHVQFGSMLGKDRKVFVKIIPD